MNSQEEKTSIIITLVLMFLTGIVFFIAGYSLGETKGSKIQLEPVKVIRLVIITPVDSDSISFIYHDKGKNHVK